MKGILEIDFKKINGESIDNPTTDTIENVRKSLNFVMRKIGKEMKKKFKKLYKLEANIDFKIP